MARKLRIRYEGALYHVINRGNYRRDVFASPGAAQAFVEVLDDALPRFGRRLHALVIMRNHFLRALETLQPNLWDGRHLWQSTYASRICKAKCQLASAAVTSMIGLDQQSENVLA